MGHMSNGYYVAGSDSDDAWISADLTCADFGVANDAPNGVDA